MNDNKDPQKPPMRNSQFPKGPSPAVFIWL